MLQHMLTFPFFLSDAVNLLDLDSQLANALGINEFSGGLLATLMMTALFLVPVLYFCRRFNISTIILSVVVAFMTLCFGVALTWVSYWVLLVVVLIAALMFAGSMRDWITGTNRG